MAKDESDLISLLAVGDKPISKCTVSKLLLSLDETEREAVLETMRKCRSQDMEYKAFTFSWLCKVLESSGKPTPTVVSFRRHMRGECACDGSTR